MKYWVLGDWSMSSEIHAVVVAAQPVDRTEGSLLSLSTNSTSRGRPARSRRGPGRASSETLGASSRARLKGPSPVTVIGRILALGNDRRRRWRPAWPRRPGWRAPVRRRDCVCLPWRTCSATRFCPPHLGRDPVQREVERRHLVGGAGLCGITGSWRTRQLDACTVWSCLSADSVRVPPRPETGSSGGRASSSRPSSSFSSAQIPPAELDGARPATELPMMNLSAQVLPGAAPNCKGQIRGSFHGWGLVPSTATAIPRAVKGRGFTFPGESRDLLGTPPGCGPDDYGRDLEACSTASRARAGPPGGRAGGQARRPTPRPGPGRGRGARAAQARARPVHRAGQVGGPVGRAEPGLVDDTWSQAQQPLDDRVVPGRARPGGERRDGEGGVVPMGPDGLRARVMLLGRARRHAAPGRGGGRRREHPGQRAGPDRTVCRSFRREDELGGARRRRPRRPRGSTRPSGTGFGQAERCLGPGRSASYVRPRAGRRGSTQLMQRPPQQEVGGGCRER